MDKPPILCPFHERKGSNSLHLVLFFSTQYTQNIYAITFTHLENLHFLCQNGTHHEIVGHILIIHGLCLIITPCIHMFTHNILGKLSHFLVKYLLLAPYVKCFYHFLDLQTTCTLSTHLMPSSHHHCIKRRKNEIKKAASMVE